MNPINWILVLLMLCDIGADIDLHRNQKGLMDAMASATPVAAAPDEPQPMTAKESADAIEICRQRDMHHTEITRKSDGAITSVQCVGPQLECGN
jgi:hypothetical protein